MFRYLCVDVLGADGLLESVSKQDQGRVEPSDVQLNASQGYKTWYWLNAYNAPHWLQYFASAGTNAVDQPTFANGDGNLQSWSNQQVGRYELDA
jgi:hypothetical protein